MYKTPGNHNFIFKYLIDFFSIFIYFDFKKNLVTAIVIVIVYNNNRYNLIGNLGHTPTLQKRIKFDGGAPCLEVTKVPLLLLFQFEHWIYPIKYTENFDAHKAHQKVFNVFKNDNSNIIRYF